MMKIKQQGLALDMAPNIQIMKYVGHFLFAYYKDPSSKFLMKVYATVRFKTQYISQFQQLLIINNKNKKNFQFNLVFILAMYAMMGMNLVYEHHDTEDLTANTITMLFFAHSIIKLTYFGSRTKKMYKAFGVWNNPNSHPIFAESNARFYAIAVAKMRRMLVIILCISIATIVGWSGITFFEEPYRKRFDRVTNETWYEEVSSFFLIFCHIRRTVFQTILPIANSGATDSNQKLVPNGREARHVSLHCVWAASLLPDHHHFGRQHVRSAVLQLHGDGLRADLPLEANHATADGAQRDSGHDCTEQWGLVQGI